MYIPLGLLWIFFGIIHGAIIRCPTGGFIDEDVCKKLIDESVLNRFYIASFDTTVENPHNIYDKPFNSFIQKDDQKECVEHNSLNELIDITVALMAWLLYGSFEWMASITTNIVKYVFDLVGTQKRDYSKPSTQQKYTIKFKQSIILDENNNIYIQWNEALSIGTDVYRLKYHSKVVRKINERGISNLSNEQCLVFIQSYFNAASTYYFSRNYETADKVLKEGSEFFKSVKFQLQGNFSKNYDVNVWEIVYSILEEDIRSSLNNVNNNNTELQNELLINLNKLRPVEGNLPIPAALFYRRYFLNSKSNTKIMENVFNDWAKKINFKSIENFTMYNNNISMDYFLMVSIIAKTTNDKLKNIINAIQRPVLCIEDRLLNYDAKEKAVEMIKPCLSVDVNSFESEVCQELRALKANNRVLDRIIITKLEKESYVNNHHKNPMNEFYNSISENNIEINQNALHIIVTNAIDFMDNESDKYKKTKKDIKLAIKLLETYVKSQLEKLNANNNNETKKNDNLVCKTSKNTPLKCQAAEDNENKSEENFKEYSPKINNNYDLEAVKNTEYSNYEIRLNNIFNAYKWLAELNGVLCNNNEQNISQYQKELKLNIVKAGEFETKYYNSSNLKFYKYDQHLAYLTNKRKAKILLPISRWEVTIWPGDWILTKNINYDKLKLQIQNTITSKHFLQKFINYLIYLKRDTICEYINRIEINILLYRALKYLKPHKYSEMYKYIKNAIDEVVITAEDRVRNLEAHELFSMYLMERNNYAIKQGIGLSHDEVYKKYLETKIN